MSYKTPTCLLLNKRQEIDSFGFEAEEKYADLCMTQENHEYYYYRQFKMKLQEGKVSKLGRCTRHNSEFTYTSGLYFKTDTDLFSVSLHIYRALTSKKTLAYFQWAYMYIGP